MKITRYLPLFAGAIIASGLVAPSPASATVVISFMGIKVCITGKKNPDGCKKLIAANPNSTTVLVNDAVMRKIDATQGRSVMVEPVRQKRAGKVRRGKLN